MVHSALRTLSVLTLLSAVSGSVILTQAGGSPAGTAADDATVAGAALAPRTNLSAIPRLSGAERSSRGGARTFIAAQPAATAGDEAGQWRAQRAGHIASEVAERAATLRRERAERQRKARERQERLERERAAERALRNARTDPQAAARALLADRGWAGQFSCLDALWTRESNWNYRAANPSSGAYGIPQSLPGRKMASAGSDWRTNPLTQMTWGLGYISDRYGSPCGAWAHSQSSGWY